MMAARLLLLTVMMVTPTEAADVKCPANHCLKRVSSGSTAASFHCEQYPDLGYQCAAENLPCTCDGFVKYGNFVQAKNPITWSDEIDVSTMTDKKIMCNTEKAGKGVDPISGAKFCWCRPKTPVATTRATVPASATTGTKPGCIIVELNAVAGGMTVEKLYGMGVNQGAVTMLLQSSILGYFKTASAKVLSYGTDTGSSLWQIDCSSDKKCFGGALPALEKLSTERKESAKAILTAAAAFIESVKALIGDLAALGPAMQLKWLPETFTKPDPATKAPSTATTGTQVSSAPYRAAGACALLLAVGSSMW